MNAAHVYGIAAMIPVHAANPRMDKKGGEGRRGWATKKPAMEIKTNDENLQSCRTTRNSAAQVPAMTLEKFHLVWK